MHQIALFLHTQKRHDKMKKEYCLKNNIKLIEIFYKRNYDLKLDDLRLEELYGL